MSKTHDFISQTFWDSYPNNKNGFLTEKIVIDFVYDVNIVIVLFRNFILKRFQYTTIFDNSMLCISSMQRKAEISLYQRNFEYIITYHND